MMREPLRWLFVKQGRQSGMWQDRSLTGDREGLKIVRPLQEFAMNIIGRKKKQEPLFQMNAASYGWLHAAACLNRDLQRDGVRRIRIPVILFQSEHDHLVSKKEQVRFILKFEPKWKYRCKACTGTWDKT